MNQRDRREFGKGQPVWVFLGGVAARGISDRDHAARAVKSMIEFWTPVTLAFEVIAIRNASVRRCPSDEDVVLVSGEFRIRLDLHPRS